MCRLGLLTTRLPQEWVIQKGDSGLRKPDGSHSILTATLEVVCVHLPCSVGHTKWTVRRVLRECADGCELYPCRLWWRLYDTISSPNKQTLKGFLFVLSGNFLFLFSIMPTNAPTSFPASQHSYLVLFPIILIWGSHVPPDHTVPWLFSAKLPYSLLARDWNPPDYSKFIPNSVFCTRMIFLLQWMAFLFSESGLTSL